MNYEQELDDLLSTVAMQSASDIHIAVGRYPTIRVDDSLLPLSSKKILIPEDTESFAKVIMSKAQWELFLATKEIDLGYSFKDKARFRVNIFRQKTFISIVMRLIPAHIRTVDELALPPILHEFTRHAQGFFLMVGPAGHGKSTTLAALVDEINHERADHIITIEDPIEYLYQQDRSIIDQREVGIDTNDFITALRSAFRQDPDVILVGEMRDAETISAALTAAETGHLIYSTLHTNNAAQTIDRIIDTFPAGQQGQVRNQLAMTLTGVVSERLIPRLEGGRIPACEVMIATPAVRNLIREAKTHEIDLVIETSADEGMISLNRALAEMAKKREISLENAELYSSNPSELRMLIGR
ncbi:MAG: type IV pili twitching motility protein PilT [Candidatus Terrybacteria bacterium RIFCSPLOWO2_01_FULL_44_24]|uniref:Type IV pili twitching motility protein PilT n=1 Tax=Candidatus Terrybacteria bacterium RIFCSPHIGHO2_01_FULL_43_35 TaxID=1802361 RepID=A0A1G2PIA6_9BACT|nr:MAG: type IV pili twitching motility protein PilT [Candidatus Terrybacteria bacterium RIFCSPHIGHO2_01_FULL_43_35]OHA50174.1 MAG: type IV pili twitching motility protein PilT [Candidatus Terrybacteria bacterium RIFCSPHIGHO2_02_FULL_43_14]OHA51233.1 MAG: type IV pili twitching motility protein PilT [Candidatus Terrybacteria bacterium RIFCSPLOWO2_01_FULL_44_24]